MGVYFYCKILSHKSLLEHNLVVNYFYHECKGSFPLYHKYQMQGDLPQEKLNQQWRHRHLNKSKNDHLVWAGLKSSYCFPVKGGRLLRDNFL